MLRAPRTSVCSCGRTEATRFCPASMQDGFPTPTLCGQTVSDPPVPPEVTQPLPVTQARLLPANRLPSEPQPRPEGTPRCWGSPDWSVRAPSSIRAVRWRVEGARRKGVWPLPQEPLRCFIFKPNHLAIFCPVLGHTPTLTRGPSEAAGGAVRTMSRGHARALHSGALDSVVNGGGWRGPCTDRPCPRQEACAPAGGPVPRQEACARQEA